MELIAYWSKVLDAPRERSMTNAFSTQHAGEICFDRFRLKPSERLLTRDGDPVDLGGRALDILIELVCNPDSVIAKSDLMARVWPDLTVEESTLRFHVSTLRKALGDGESGARYIATIAGRGYRFVAPIDASGGTAATEPSLDDVGVRHLLPPRVVGMIGRGEGVHDLSARLISSRFVTITGPGGVGKTTLALAIAHDMLEPFVGGVLFVDFGMLSDPNMVTTSLASTLGIAVRSRDPTPSLVTFLRNKRILLVLDNCEHVVDSVAAIASQIYRGTPQVHLLTTSREALRAAGEFVYKLDPLEVPPDDTSITATDALRFPAAQLFIDSATASGARLTLNDADAALVTAICRKLDGVALAIELAAGRVEALGLQQTATLLDQHLTLLWQGSRSAPERQKTLQATLNWSYELLSPEERWVLRCLSVFPGHFTLDGAINVTHGEGKDPTMVIDTIESLVGKSMLAARQSDGITSYRLLATTRAYILGLAADTRERTALAGRYASYCLKWLENNAATLHDTVARSPYLAGINDVRVALEWTFGPGGDRHLGIALAASASPIFLTLSLLDDCRHWSETAIAALDEPDIGDAYEMHLQAAFGLSMMFTRGSSSAAHVALSRSLAIAIGSNDPRSELQLMAPLTMYYLRIGHFKAAIELGRRALKLSIRESDPAVKALAHAITGISLTHTGDLVRARAELEAAHERQAPLVDSKTIYLGFDGHDLAGIFLAKTLWLQGLADQAVAHAHRTIADAIEKDHPVTLSIALIWAISLYISMDEIETAEELLERFTQRARLHQLEPYLAAGRAYEGLLAIRRGEVAPGVPMLESAIVDLQVARYELLTTTFSVALATGLAASGRATDALELVDRAIREVENSGDVSHMPELLRTKASVLGRMPNTPSEQIESCLESALDWSRMQGALTSELAATIDLATFRQDSGQSGARHLLQPVYLRITEGFETPLVRRAERLLARLP
ncbi:ATP-binding protein [Rhizobium sp. Root708]|uniref:ATP-binding protein n=1 Tax=Rhizobium sp. Root708 TaxID=1736592 RepID=UPI001FCD87B6|nr:winged helix-turn-helix domain-containing protein [Rhizobium sp. Root708]